MMDNFLMDTNMVKALWFSLMDQNMKEILKKINCAVLEKWLKKMEKHMKGNDKSQN